MTAAITRRAAHRFQVTPLVKHSSLRLSSSACGEQNVELVGAGGVDGSQEVDDDVVIKHTFQQALEASAQKSRSLIKENWLAKLETTLSQTDQLENAALKTELKGMMLQNLRIPRCKSLYRFKRLSDRIAAMDASAILDESAQKSAKGPKLRFGMSLTTPKH
ncbi:Uu.00g113500.m01.CDS01 [Anthostomella pinea]|uniref:Uu.00g113500.m01.CDS01 n=1 Tax=Anthostomella pinea TaxID=933095 RepID=A0AAI8VG65_9PEZI|nr:Uu.00g113500.m01.CDS01 [Anthostomella pinea]